VLALPRRNLATYRRIARAAGKIWMEFGGLDYRECGGDDVKGKAAAPFGKAIRLKPVRGGRVHLDRLQVEGAAEPDQRKDHEGAAHQGHRQLLTLHVAAPLKQPRQLRARLIPSARSLS
jgi:hypothetical protein